MSIGQAEPIFRHQDSKNAIKQYADQMNKDSMFQTIVLAYPNVENQSSINDRNRFPLTGTIDSKYAAHPSLISAEGTPIAAGAGFTVGFFLGLRR